ncbi:homocysteine S-methyltransferase [Tersicoccus solisilvae]|uniref:Homocysteine S-methyltransferase n=1 Tax=Tersicoccus solisilvae TaxID=1882339 RepID=A0ABQ1NMV8_9MICC|nr:homocysteine S-methyltransferase family protein [Tersicoccus solisilvae]GGC79334.1 homocysteine S-methyltransferase [Tersicoccus solisilvae]
MATTTVLDPERRYVTDGGMETDLIFHHGVDLPEFAAFPLVEDAPGRELLTAYYLGYADVAGRAGAGLLLESPTWRANPDWGARLGYDAPALDRANRAAIAFLRRLADRLRDRVPAVLVNGMVGPRYDGYHPNAAMSADEATAYHGPQLASFAAAGVDLVTAYTLGSVAEAQGIVEAARDEALPVGISFTVETDGTLPDGTPLGAAVQRLDAVAAPDHYLVNCAHPDHIARGIPADAPWRHRVAGTRVNASRLSHADLDEAEALDDGDPAELAADHRRLAARLPGLRILGGCCGTDVRHVAALWGQ